MQSASSGWGPFLPKGFAQSGLSIHAEGPAASGPQRAASWAETSSSQCSTAEEEDSDVETREDQVKLIVKGRVWLLAQDPKGCRLLQEAIEGARSEASRWDLAMELRGHVAKAVRCPQANHVIQKCITAWQPEEVQFIIDELLARDGLLAQAARHRYGCRVVQQLFHMCAPTQMQPIAELLLQDALVFTCHPFGNYVMQKLLEHGTATQRHRLNQILGCHASAVCDTYPGRNVVSAALVHGVHEDQVRLVRALLQEPSLLQALVQQRAGKEVVMQVLQVVEGEEAEGARHSLLACPVSPSAPSPGERVTDLLSRTPNAS